MENAECAMSIPVLHTIKNWGRLPILSARFPTKEDQKAFSIFGTLVSQADCPTVNEKWLCNHGSDTTWKNGNALTKTVTIDTVRSKNLGPNSQMSRHFAGTVLADEIKPRLSSLSSARLSISMARRHASHPQETIALPTKEAFTTPKALTNGG